MDEKELWEKCASFHGHECGGLTIGYKASLYAIRLLGLEAEKEKAGKGCFSADEELVCICENDACGVDAIQVILGCSIGKGNLLFHMTGKQAFSFYSRKTGKAVRLVLKPRPEGMTKAESFQYYQASQPEEMFEVKEAKLTLPEPARIFKSIPCSRCGESTAEHMIHLHGDEMLCPDCYQAYNRFAV